MRSARLIAYNYGELSCGESVLAKNGTLCEGAVYPGVPLTQDETARAAELFRTAISPMSAAGEVSWEARPSIRCFEPHHSIVFFDDHATPIGEMTICFECGNFRLMPGRDDERSMTDAEGIFIADLFRALGVGGCPPAGTFRMPDGRRAAHHQQRLRMQGWPGAGARRLRLVRQACRARV